MINKIDHIGIAVKSLREAIPFYEKTLGLECEGIEEIASQKVKVAFFRVGEVRIELLEPTAAESPVRKYLDKRGGGIHHIAYRSDDLEGDLAQAGASGCRLVDETPKEGAGGKRIAFLHPKSTGGVLTELCSK